MVVVVRRRLFGGMGGAIVPFLSTWVNGGVVVVAVDVGRGRWWWCVVVVVVFSVARVVPPCRSCRRG